MFEYFLFGMKTMWESPVFSFDFYLLASILLLIFWRRFIIVRRSGGDFFCPVSHCQWEILYSQCFCICEENHSAE